MKFLTFLNNLELLLKSYSISNSLKFENLTFYKNLYFCKKTKIYINLIYLCDKINDCPNGEDELDCHENQQKFYFRCNSITNETYINYLKICDFNPDCIDKSDEKYCSYIQINAYKISNI